MKEADITPEIIKLSKDIAEHWRMEIYEGCWAYDKGFNSPPWLIRSKRYRDGLQGVAEIIPIPSISGCERKLAQLGWTIYRTIQHEQAIDHHELGDMWQVVVRRRWDENKKDWIEMMASTHHEALLSALLEVLKI